MIEKYSDLKDFGKVEHGKTKLKNSDRINKGYKRRNKD